MTRVPVRPALVWPAMVQRRGWLPGAIAPRTPINGAPVTGGARTLPSSHSSSPATRANRCAGERAMRSANRRSDRAPVLSSAVQGGKLKMTLEAFWVYVDSMATIPHSTAST
jgi:hypothetical protein